MPHRDRRPVTYQGAGVDIGAGEEAVERIKSVVASTARPEVLGGIGGFGGAFAFDPSTYDKPVLVSSTDGVGTKALVAAAARRYDTIGIDLVAMCADDVVCSGAEPLFLLDYIATGAVDPATMEQLVGGVADGCRQAGCALIGGEMAEHPGAMEPGTFDLAGFCVGVVERDRILGPERVRAGDALVALFSPGLRCNGYTLARHVLLERGGRRLDDPAWDGAPHSAADELLRPSVVYTPFVLAVLEAFGTDVVHGAAHVTGGGIPGNVCRILGPDADAVMRRGSWPEPEVFGEIQRLGDVADDEMARAFNLGVGMVLAVEAASGDAVAARLTDEGCPSAVVGDVRSGSGLVFIEKAS